MASDKALTDIAADVGELRKSADRAEGRLDHHDRMFEEVMKSLTEIQSSMRQLQVSITTLASSVGLAMTELAVSRTLERRIERFEAAVFPPKH